ncbi:voltage-gated purine nucleotide uniporter SLC17A9 isoform X2 [Culicoides brevitarsis]|uniref:voltage-gated purine nucleotide uniporter SLC17A9 isoform X1 n=1 Tax=Culicoides brevitarsis TaxID=469753 RepID=UPI00307C8092
MEQKLRLLRSEEQNQSVWTRNEKRTWFLTLIVGTCMLYSTRTSMPLLLPSVAAEQKWSKTDSGTVLSAFFWGYTLTQVLGGYFSDKYGGEEVILLSAIGWSLITFWMPNIISLSNAFGVDYAIGFIVIIRILNGALQGLHFPAMSSLTSRNLSPSERTSFFSILTSGSAIGTLLTGSFGSLLLDYFGWSVAFRVIGFFGLIWTLVLRYHTMATEKHRIVTLDQPNRYFGGGASYTGDTVPWLKFFRKSSFWACVLTHACEMNCFFVLLSWLPTYFHENYPNAKGWLVNMVPWATIPFFTYFAKWLTDKMVARKASLTRIRKIIESLCFLTQNCALFIMCHTNSYPIALICMSIITGASGFHNSSCTINPQDLAPNHSGSVFGLMNTFGAVPGFLGVYLAGHILELTSSWAAVFHTSIAINTIGWLIFAFFASAEPISV